MIFWSIGIYRCIICQSLYIYIIIWYISLTLIVIHIIVVNGAIRKRWTFIQWSMDIHSMIMIVSQKTNHVSSVDTKKSCSWSNLSEHFDAKATIFHNHPLALSPLIFFQVTIAVACNPSFVVRICGYISSHFG